MGDAVEVVDEHGKPLRMHGILWDITERKQAEEKIKHSLAEKETLLRELHHRTKNNMQVIIALLELQASYFEDQRLKEAFEETRNRIRSMALVHEKLYQAHDLSHINLKEYIGELAQLLLASYKISSNHVSLVLDIEEVQVLIDTAIPCGLILNELISNSLKYAFPEDRYGEIRIQLYGAPDGEIYLNISDNGVGMPTGFDARTSGRLGLQNVFLISEKQLKGKITFASQPGVSYQIQFKDNLYQPRI
jgi:two-component sensor histidine kinase